MPDTVRLPRGISSILLSSDIHALKPVYELFASLLAEGPWDAGVIAGDLLDSFWLPDGFLIERLGVTEEELIDELPGEDELEPDAEVVSRREELNERGLLLMEAEIKAILGQAGKPVFIVPGNHDTTPWADAGNLVNLDGRKVEAGDWNLVGFRWTRFELGEEEMAERLAPLERLVDSRTILVSHDPPYGVLDQAWSGSPIGSEEPGRLVARLRPAWHFFGHVHSQAGFQGRSVNGAYPFAREFFGVDLAGGSVGRVPAEVALVPRIPL